MEKAKYLTCVEVGGSGCQTVTFDHDGNYTITDGAVHQVGSRLALAVPGLVDVDGRTTAVNLGWTDADPVTELALAGPAEVVMNDAAAAALGESALRGGPDLAFLGLGTGIGGAVVSDGSVIDNLFAHKGGFGEQVCPCGNVGCLETIAGGWALPATLDESDVGRLATNLALAVVREPLAGPGLVVVAGGLVTAHRELVNLIADRLPGYQVDASAAPVGAKSAAPWGLRLAVDGPAAPMPVDVSVRR